MKELPVGHQVGHYRIRSVAGRGAVGIVYLAEHETQNPVAIKTLSPIYAGEPIFRERFSREAQGAAAVDHPNIIKVFDTGEIDGLPYLVMTYVDGPDLERVLTDRGGKIEPAEAVLICAAIADALDAAGAQGLAHRDVKPANILLEGWSTGDGGGRQRRPHVYLTDFGLIKSSAQARVTQTGQFVGTLLYMAPEQIESRAVPASDQYSLACVLWESLTGSFPFEPTGGSTLSLLTAHISHPVPAISERPGRWSRSLDEVFFRALAKKPDDRYPSSTAFIDDATRALGLGTAAPAVTKAPPKTAIEHTQIIPTSPPTREGAAPPRTSQAAQPGGGGAPGGAGPGGGQPGSAGPGGGQPGGAGPGGGQPAHPPSPLAGSVPASPPGGAGGGPPQWTGHPGGQPDPRQSIAGTPSSFPQALGRGGPAGLPQGTVPESTSSSSKGLITGAVILVLLIIAAIAAVIVFDGDDGEGSSSTGDAQSLVADAADGDGATDEGAADDDAAGPAAADGVADDLGEDAAEDPATDLAAGGVIPASAQGRVAFVGDADIWVVGAGGDPVNVTGGLVEQPVQPAWRPGHDALLVASAQGLRLIDLAAGPPGQVVTANGAHSDPAWDPSGERIVYSTPVDGGRDLAIIAAAGGTPQALGIADAAGAPLSPNRPAWSPDGSQIAFQTPVGESLAIWVVDAGGGEPAAAAGVDDARDFHPAWTLDGELLFSSDRSGREQIWLRDAATGEERIVGDGRDGEPVFDADISPCGDWMAYQLETPEGSRVGIAPLDPSAAEGTTVLPLPAGVEDARDPSWAGQPCEA